MAVKEAVDNSDTTVRLLADAASLLPSVVEQAPVLTCDVHTLLLLAGGVSVPSSSRVERLRMATRALDEFINHLVLAGHVRAEARASQTLRSWLRLQRPRQVQQALAEAADHGGQRRRRP